MQFKNYLTVRRLFILLTFLSSLTVYSQSLKPTRITGLRPNSPFGLGFRADGDQSIMMQVAQDIGVKWQRGTALTQIENWNSGKRDAARAEIQQWKNKGVIPLITLFYPNNMRGPGISPPSDFNVYADACKSLIDATQDLTPNYEHWNEPWIDEWAWHGGTSNEYRNMIKLIWDKSKTQYPNINLIGGGSVSFNRDVLYPVNTPNTGYADGSISHAYGFPSHAQLGITMVQMELDKKYSLTHGRAGAWQTELGVNKGHFSSDGPTWAARCVAPIYIQHMLAGYYTNQPVKIFWFSYGLAGFSGGEFNIRDTPTQTAYANMTLFLEGTTVKADPFPKSKALWGMVSEDESGKGRAAVFVGGQWGAEPTVPGTEYTGTMSISSGAGRIEAYDYMGNYISSLSSISLTPWQTVYLVSDMSATNLQAALQNAEFHLNTEVQVNPLSITGPLLTGRTIDVQVENVVNKNRNATLSITAPSGITLSTSSISISNLAPGEKRIVSFPISTFTTRSDNKYTVNYTLQVEGQGSTKTGSQTVQVAFAPKQTFTIDANLNDWTNVVGTSMANGTYTLKTAWDDNYLYVAAEVADDAHNPEGQWNNIKNSATDFVYANKDGVFLNFDVTKENPDDLLRAYPNYEKVGGADVDYEFFMSYAIGNVPELLRYRAIGTNNQNYYPLTGATTPPLGKMDLSPGGGSEGKIQMTRVGTKTVYEVAIDWKAIPELKPKLTGLAANQQQNINFAWKVNGGNAGDAYWTKEAGQVEEGAYGFMPTWTGGKAARGGRIVTRWSFVNGNGSVLPTGGNVAPSVSITSPAANAIFTAPASVTVTASASDSDGTVSRVDFYNGSTLIGTATSSPYTITWSNVAAGTYQLTAKATDNGGASTTSSSVSIIVNGTGNVAPTVSITSPVNNATFAAPAAVTINANAGDTDGTVSKVDFYNGTTLLGTDTSSPYSFTWSSVAAGTYTLSAQATDNGGAATTSSTISITVGGTGSPDLIVTDITQTIVSGSTVRFSAVVKNQGTGATPSGTILGVAFSVSGTVANWEDTYTTSLAPGASVTLSATGGPGGVNTWNATSANYTVQAFVDDVNRISESNDSNNTFSKALTTTGGNVVTGVSVSPTTASIIVGGTQQLTATITPSNATNQSVSWSSSNTSVATVSSIGLVTAVAAGTATITVTTADGGKTATSTITVTAPSGNSDLIVTDITQTIVSGSTVRFSTVVKNQGTGATAAGTIIGVAFSVSGTVTNWEDTYTTSLAPGASVTLTATGGPSGVNTWNATSANYTVQAYVDDVNRIIESNETNNTFSKALTTTGGTVSVISVSVSPTTASITVGGTQQLTATVSPSNATNQSVSWSSSNTSVATVNSSGLVTAVAAGTSTITVTTTDGIKTATSAITVTPASTGNPDLVVTSVTLSPASPKAGDLVTFTAIVKNQGTGNVPAGTLLGVAFWVGSVQVACFHNGSTVVAPGEVVTGTANACGITWTAGAAGSYSVKAIVDDVNRITESNETNNETSVAFTVGTTTPTGNPDLIVTDITQTVSGSTVRFSAVVKNQGTGNTPAGTIIGAAFSIGGSVKNWSDTYTTSLAPGASVTLTANGGPSGTATWNATSSSYTVQAYVDDVNRITESNESNNTFSKALSTTGGRLGIEETENTSVLSIYPNPAKNSIEINHYADEAGVAYVDVMNELGQSKADKKFKVEKGSNKLYLDISNLNTGLHYIRLNNGHQTAVKKLVIK